MSLSYGLKELAGEEHQEEETEPDGGNVWGSSDVTQRWPFTNDDGKRRQGHPPHNRRPRNHHRQQRDHQREQPHHVGGEEAHFRGCHFPRHRDLGERLKELTGETEPEGGNVWDSSSVVAQRCPCTNDDGRDQQAHPPNNRRPRNHHRQQRDHQREQPHHVGGEEAHFRGCHFPSYRDVGESLKEHAGEEHQDEETKEDSSDVSQRCSDGRHGNRCRKR
ncbi:hypothetical protein B296_00044902 [Ensete ventricosum]|uniref:Uncharacterized protein n=1 Tax=Ensete ventricosum TaxID=4639 RepID=A0A426YVP6_ENSVE|nr:hypothetical protein B296_00044902 [Ensete ventricosum]